jgi:hypothetical protein
LRLKDLARCEQQIAFVSRPSAPQPFGYPAQLMDMSKRVCVPSVEHLTPR